MADKSTLLTGPRLAQLGLAAAVLFALGFVAFLLMGQALIGMLVGAGVGAMRLILGLLPLG